MGYGSLYEPGSGVYNERGYYGYVRPRVIPMTMLAGLLGFIAGKASYYPVIQYRFIRERPNSELSKVFRREKGMPEPEFESAADEKNVKESMPEITISQNDPMGLKDSKLFGKIREGHQPLWNQSSATPEPEQKIERQPDKISTNKYGDKGFE